MKTIHLIITGRVQGVAYRASTLEKAQALGIKGWVRNLADGSVECVAQGNQKQLEDLTLWCKEGPRFAEVTEVTSTPIEDNEEFEVFEIRR